MYGCKAFGADTLGPFCGNLVKYGYHMRQHYSVSTDIRTQPTIGISSRKPTYHQFLSGVPAHAPAPPGGPCVPAAAPALHDPLGRPVRLSSRLDSKVTRRAAGATQQLSDRRETPFWDRPIVLSRKPTKHPAGTHEGAYVLQHANQLW